MAVGKINLILADGCSPRLVVDSSISEVTDNTVLPNRICLPRISDVLTISPDCPAQNPTAGLALDVAKARRRIKIHPENGALLFFILQANCTQPKPSSFELVHRDSIGAELRRC